MTFATTDLCDDHPQQLEDARLVVLPPVFQHFGQRVRFCGRVTTLKVFEDNTLVRVALEAPGNGNVLVVDGCVRDSDEINACDIGVRALATHPKRSARKGTGDCNVRVFISGVAVSPGDWIYADADGVLVARQELA
jgi:regulator of ribonuclease activity A